MNFYHFILSEIASYISFIPLCIAVYKRKTMLAEYAPIFIYLAVSFTNEIISSIAYYTKHSAYMKPFTNTYLLIYPLLLIWQFKNWRLFHHKEWLYRFLLAFTIVDWIFCLFVFGKMTQTTNWHRIINYVILTFISISNLNRVISRNTPDLLRNTNFIVTCACLLHYPPRLIIDVFYMYGLDKDISFIVQVYVILNIATIIFYLQLAYGLLWTDRKQPYLLPY